MISKLTLQSPLPERSSVPIRGPSGLGRLSSGLRVGTPSEENARSATSERLQSQMRSVKQAERNASDAIGLLQTAEGAMSRLGQLLQEVRELAIRARDRSLSSQERGHLDERRQELVSDVEREALLTAGPGMDLLRREMANPDAVELGNHGQGAANPMRVALGDAQASVLRGSNSIQKLDLMSPEGADQALSDLDYVIDDVSTAKDTIHKVRDRLTRTVANLVATRENLNAADARIRDATVAQEAAQRAQDEILSQAGYSLLAQANQVPSNVLSLLS